MGVSPVVSSTVLDDRGSYSSGRRGVPGHLSVIYEDSCGSAMLVSVSPVSLCKSETEVRGLRHARLPAANHCRALLFWSTLFVMSVYLSQSKRLSVNYASAALLLVVGQVVSSNFGDKITGRHTLEG